MKHWIALLAIIPVRAADLPLTVEFNRDVRPILSDKCFACHGPDQSTRKSKLRLDVESGSAYLDKKVILDRIKSTSKALRMPPVFTGSALEEREIALLEKWVHQGAKYENHWSLIPPKAKPEWANTGIDHFVLERLQREGLNPSPEADRGRLIRRVTFDLTGLPPTPREVDAFLNDKSPKAYEALVDRLLQSPRYGERMAIRWLDAARYADTNGYQNDAERNMWRWRDWVIEAFNKNKPYNEFIVEQLAGDLLPNATRDQIIATGFNRNHRGNSEGGIVPEEYAVEYVVDRLDTASTVFLGLTLGCARCHDHKYDPITQKEYYQLYSFFDNIGEWGRYIKYGNTPPYVSAPTADQERQLLALESKFAAAHRALANLQPEIDQQKKSWENALNTKTTIDWQFERALQSRLNGGEFDGKSLFDAGKDAGAFGFYDKFTIAAWIKPNTRNGAIFARGKDVSEEPGYGLYLVNGKLQVHMTVRWLDDALRVETERSLDQNAWHHVTMRYDGTRLASGVSIYVDGQQQKTTVLLDLLNQNFATTMPFLIGGGSGTRFEGEIRDLRIFKAALHDSEIQVLAPREAVNEIVALATRTAQQQAKLDQYFLKQIAPNQIREAAESAFKASEELASLKETIPTVMVMREVATPKDVHVLIRGAYDRPGVKVERNLPASLPPLPPGAPRNRLGLALWLTSPNHPLTARVAVNRFWQMLFGTGIVKTVEDFGSQGEWPSNPELLDFMATEFVSNGWNLKGLIKSIAMSSTYRQSSKASPALIARDPDNRLLARGPRLRLAAEMVRDQALAAAGLLVEQQGGPSVKPYQPAGLWKELSNEGDYKPDTGEALYRRSLYTFWKRTIPPPFMMNFDSAGREACTVRETRTNTPLQALNLMNDVTYLEASRKVAERMMLEGGTTAAERIAFGFKLATARLPNPAELALLEASYRRNLDRYTTKPEDAAALLKQGDSPRNQLLDSAALAACAQVASLILNLDEVVSKE